LSGLFCLVGWLPAAVLAETDQIAIEGLASFYSHAFHGRRTAQGGKFDSKRLTAASNLFPLGSLVAVRRSDNDRCTVVRINDRMHRKNHKRIIDLSRSAAADLHMLGAGVVRVRVALLPEGLHNAGPAACRAAFEPANAPESCLSCDAPANTVEPGAETAL